MIATVDEGFAFASKLRLAFTVRRRRSAFGGHAGSKVAKRERLLRFCLSVAVGTRAGSSSWRFPQRAGER